MAFPISTPLMLQHHDLLATIAQVSATFAGFSGIIGIFQRSGSPAEFNVGTLQVRGVVELSVLATVLSLLPFIPDGYGAPEAVTWRLCSGIAAAALILRFVGGMRRVRVSVGEVVATDRLLVAVAVGGLGACQTALWLNILDITFGAAATRPTTSRCCCFRSEALGSCSSG